MNIKTLLSVVLLTFFNFSNIFSQYEIKIQAFVLDQDTKKPVSYANIGFVDKAIGTVTNKSGRFYLQYDEDKIRDNDKFKISCIGYESLRLNQKQLFDLLNNNNTILLKPLPYNLDEAVDTEKTKKDEIGYVSFDSNLLAYWKDKKALGGEIAALINVKNEHTKLRNLKFNVAENTADSLLVRVNIYTQKGKKPAANLLKRNIYHSISRKKGEEVIDLSSYNIELNEDFIASIELIKVYGDDIQFAVNVGKGGCSYLRHISQDGWKEHKGAGIAFTLETSHPVISDELKERDEPEHIVLYWDTSLSMQVRDLRKELAFLKTYMSKIKKATVDIVTFSDELGKRESIQITNGNSKALIDMLSALRYNGGSDFSKLFAEIDKPDQYLVFTDGLDTYGNHQFIYGTPVFYINSIEKANDKELQEGGYTSEGHYLNLSKMSIDKALTYINHELEDDTVYNNHLGEELVSGKVFSDGVAVQGCKVSVKGTLTEAVTDANGNFSIDAGASQVLYFQHFSMKSKEVTLDASKTIQVELKPKYENLNEVALSKKNNDEFKEKVNLGSTKIEKHKLGFASYTKQSEQFPAIAIHLTDIIRGQFPGVQVIGYGDDSSISVRGRSSVSLGNAPLFVVDNAIQLLPPYYLIPAMIKSITLIPGLSGAIRYGTAARNGVFIIETKLAASIEANSQPKDQLLVKGNDYKESNLLIDPSKNRPKYLNALYNTTSYSDALEVYYQLRETHMYEVPFYVHCSEYFKRWDTKFSKQVISNLAEMSNDNYGVLRTLAFLLEERKDIQKAVVVYENLFDLKPDYAQSYLDLGRIYKENKEYAKAFDVYKQVLEEHKDVEEYTEVRKQAESELRHLLNHYRSYISYNDIPEAFLTVKGVPVRIVFDWNDPQAEFEFQFVSPKKKYEKWTHRFDDNEELLNDEVQYGIASKEFTVDDSTPGEWIINVQSHGKVSKLNPTYLKYTMYRNYGLANETKTVKFIKLYNQKEKVTLDKFSI